MGAAGGDQGCLGLGTCTVRTYTYDRRANRTGKATRTGSSAGECPGDAEPAQTETHSYDSADRITDPGYGYDAFGRITATPAGVSHSYFVNDLLAGQQSSDARMSWTLDPALRFRKYTAEKLVDGAWANAVTKVNHYGADGDDPRWIAEDSTQNTNLTRNIESPEGDLAVTTGASGRVATFTGGQETASERGRHMTTALTAKGAKLGFAVQRDRPSHPRCRLGSHASEPPGPTPRPGPARPCPRALNVFESRTCPAADAMVRAGGDRWR